MISPNQAIHRPPDYLINVNMTKHLSLDVYISLPFTKEARALAFEKEEA